MESKLKSTSSYRAVHVDGLEDEQIRTHEYLYQYTEYDQQGNMILEETHIPDGAVEHKSSYRYDSQGRLIEELLLEEDDFVSEHRTMEYNEKALLWREQNHYLDGSFDETIYSYDDSGKLLTRESVSDEGDSGNKVEISYENNNPVSEIEYDSEGAIVTEKRFEFDEKGNLTSESVVSPEGSYKLVHEFAENGNKMVTRRYNDDGQLIERSAYLYDEQARVIQVKEESVNGIEILTVQYDERGNITVQDAVTDQEEPVSRINRTYDDDNRLLSTYVHVEGHGQQPTQDYRIRFEYSFWD